MRSCRLTGGIMSSTHHQKATKIAEVSRPCGTLLRHLSMSFIAFCSLPILALANPPKSANALESMQIQLIPGGLNATDSTSSPEENPNEYFTFDESKPGTLLGANAGFNSPASLAREIVGSSGVIKSTAVALTRWVKHETAPPIPVEKYNRKYHFGTWINDPTDTTCYNNRAKVLIRDSKTQVTFKANNKCVVESGTWDDPYTGNRYYMTKDIQIDHVVPLRHAYQAGAWKWNYKTRCIYGNFMANNYHLLSVNGHENMSKGDKAPDAYIPPNRRVTCTYVQAWLQIKLAWGLVMFPKEAQAIQEIIKNNSCDTTKFSMDRTELARQRKAMTDAIQICNRTPTSPTTVAQTTIGTSFPSNPPRDAQ